MCEACDLAEQNPKTGMIHAGCKGCSARSLAKSPQFAEARDLGKMTPMYLSALKRVFGDEHEAGHRLVKEWSTRLKEKP